MDKSAVDYIAERAEILCASRASTQATKDAALAWKEAVAAGGEGAANVTSPRQVP